MKARIIQKAAVLASLVLAGAVGCTRSNSPQSTASNHAADDAHSAGQSSTGGANSASPSGRVLNIYCWSSYMAPEIIQKFEESRHVKIVFNYFSSNEELLAKLQAGARGYDLIVPTAYLIRPLKELGLIQPLGKLDSAALNQDLLPRFRNPAFDPQHELTVPFAWGTTGIAVNRVKLKTEKVDSWAWVFDHPELKGQVTMLDDAPAVVGAALKYLGYSYNESSPDALAKVKALLIKQKKFLKAYTPESQPVLSSGEFAVAQAYSGDTLQVRARKNPNVEYVMPKEGGEIFVDSLAIPKGAPSPDLAKEFILYTLEKPIATIQVRHLFFSPVVDLKQSLSGADAPLRSEAAIFPSEQQLKGFETMQDDPKRIETISQMWTELKSL